jgi:hypothetical protein
MARNPTQTLDVLRELHRVAIGLDEGSKKPLGNPERPVELQEIIWTRTFRSFSLE